MNLPAVVYVVSQAGPESGRTIYLVDRVVYRDRFWITNPDEAKKFTDLEIAQLSADKLIYNDARPMELNIARVKFREEERQVANRQLPVGGIRVHPKKTSFQERIGLKPRLLTQN